METLDFIARLFVAIAATVRFLTTPTRARAATAIAATAALVAAY